MATEFHIQFMEEDDINHQVAIACFELIDELESKLSRFIPDSDISRINRLKLNEELLLDVETYDCLKMAIEVNQWTNGAFDIGVGEFMNIFRGYKEGVLNYSEHRNALSQALEEKQAGSIYLDPDEHKIYCVQPGIQLDLGAIGKGFALDYIAEMIQREGIKNFTLSASDSTILVFQDGKHQQESTYKLAANEEEIEVELQNESVSASGTYWQGNHIFDPRIADNTSDIRYDRMWVCCKKASLSDAFSTGMFLLNEDEVENIVYQSDAINWAAYSQNGKIVQITKA